MTTFAVASVLAGADLSSSIVIIRGAAALLAFLVGMAWGSVVGQSIYSASRSDWWHRTQLTVNWW
ncbi:hypothetical protein [Rubripirellula tenax]|uniref:hypothetical protein n=1 Tax=Rubripirellula tenax TaxID=2528015 RepID=UPI0036F37345